MQLLLMQCDTDVQGISKTTSIASPIKHKIINKMGKHKTDFVHFLPLLITGFFGFVIIISNCESVFHFRWSAIEIYNLLFSIYFHHKLNVSTVIKFTLTGLATEHQQLIKNPTPIIKFITIVLNSPIYSPMIFNILNTALQVISK